MDEDVAGSFATQTAVLFEVILWISQQTSADKGILANKLYELRGQALRSPKKIELGSLNHLLHLLETQSR